MNKNIRLLVKGRPVDAQVFYSDEPPWRLKLVVQQDVELETEADDLFNALVKVRDMASREDIIVLCNGARKDVYPSPMTRGMAGGQLAYKLVLGCQAKKADLVNIFDPASKDDVTTPEEQMRFYEEWLRSLE